MDIKLLSLLYGLILFAFKASKCQFLEEDSIKLIAIADWGGIDKPPYTTSVQLRVAETLANVVKDEGVDFILSLGDHFYHSGVQNVNDQRFKITFEDVYNYDSLNIPWYFVAGNHDYIGNVKAQIDYSKLSPRWNFPDFYYKLTRQVPGGKTLDIVLLDTPILCGRIFDEHQPGPSNVVEAEKEWAWLEEQLKNSRADYLLVAGHYPVHSVGWNGPTHILIHRLEPLLIKYNVNAYISGHDHSIQHIQRERGGKTVNYFISAGSALVDTTTVHQNTIQWYELKYRLKNPRIGGLVLFQVNDSAITVKFMNGRGGVRYSYELLPRV